MSAFGYVIMVPKMRATLRRGPRLINTRPNQLPERATRELVGRAEALADLDDLYYGDGRRRTRHAIPVVLEIVGLPGVGKSELAVHWARRTKDHFPDGVLYAQLRGHDEPISSGLVLGRFLRGLGVRAADVPVGVAERASLFQRLVAQRRVLIVLDDAATADQLTPFLPAGSRSVVLVTSRTGVTDSARRVVLDVLDSDESVRLLAAYVGAARVEAEPQALRDLAALCGHWPLMLSLAAHCVLRRPGVPASTFVENLRSAIKPVDGRSLMDSAVWVTVDEAYRTLPDRAAALFRRLAILPSKRVSQREAALLAGVDDGDVGVLLNTLVSVSMLQRTADPAVYHLHDLLWSYARAQLDEQEPDQIPVLRRQIRRRPSERTAPTTHQAASESRTDGPGRRRPARPDDLG
ncbi:NB-ARC domain-containing protein [Kibdelosporangium lantanae]|uniref:NB-ARC domain-containing protein n=1 Tax=Kibdelosporangium lantanae TaxID=1497396 RepID=A0ABW3M086_9PSEU